jgi:hypothetical protein
MFTTLFKKKLATPPPAEDTGSISIGQPSNKPSAATEVKKACLVVHPPIAGEAQRTVVVLGVERGGTSMVAGIIRALGVNMGRRAGLNHEDPKFIADQDGKLAKAIKERNAEDAVWGFKMPKAVNKLDFLEEHLRAPYYVIAHRNLAAVADSWNQRGAGQYLDVLERALDYHQLILKHLRKSRRPALIVNYERSVQEKEQTVRELASFLGLKVDEAAVQRAVEMITGDGKGYVNLPEHYFNVAPGGRMPERRVMATEANRAEVTDDDGWISFENLKKKLVLRLPDGGNLPKKFWLKLHLDAPASLDLATTPVRVYFDFIGDMFPGHCARPMLKRGTNFLLVETSGFAQGVGFGPLAAGTRLKLDPVLHEAAPEDAV